MSGACTTGRANRSANFLMGGANRCANFLMMMDLEQKNYLYYNSQWSVFPAFDDNPIDLFNFLGPHRSGARGSGPPEAGVSQELPGSGGRATPTRVRFL